MRKDKPGNPPAFPSVKGYGNPVFYDGMSLRDYFAAAVLQGLMAYPADNNGTNQLKKEAMRYADCSYAMADAMLKARAS